MTSNNQIITSKTKKYNQIAAQAYYLLKDISQFYSSEVKLLVFHLYKQGYSVDKVAKILGVTKQAISLRYPKMKGEKHV